MRLAWGLEDAVGHYLSAHFPELMTLNEYRPHRAVGFVNAEHRLVGGLGLTFENAFDGQLSIYVEQKNFLTPRMLRELFGWAFNETELVRLSCHIAKRNRKARAFVERIGFKQEGLKRMGFDGRRDAVLYGMTRADCRWL